jgi:hypothetical protein
VKRRIAFLPQNDTHVPTLRSLADALASRGCEVVVVDLDGVFHQGLELGRLDRHLVRVPLTTDLPFYRLSAPRQVATVLEARRPLARALRGATDIVAFNDGALQRLAFDIARRRGARTFLALDGMISDYGPPAGRFGALRRHATRVTTALGGTPLGPLLPSEIGMYPVDELFTIGPHSAEVLARQGSRARRILPVGLPRWNDGRLPPAPRVRSLLYLTGAFAWHNDPVTGRAQVDDAALLARVCNAVGVELVVRLHPRDDPEPYRASRVPFVSARSERIELAFERADLVTSMVSTGMLEAISMGRLARTIMIHANPSRFARSFALDPLLGPLTTEEALRHAIEGLSRSIPEAATQVQREGLSRFVAAGGQTATERIVDEIMRTHAV